MLTRRTVRSEYEVKITRQDLIDLLAQQDVPEPINVPQSADITIHVPGGGDYSNTDLDLRDCPITIHWTTQHNQES